VIEQSRCAGYIGRDLKIIGNGEKILPVKIGSALVQDVEILPQTDEGAVFNLTAAEDMGSGPRDAKLTGNVLRREKQVFL